MTDETNSFERYNHISNGGYWFRTYTERNAQYLEIGLSNHGIPSTTTIMLNSHVIRSLREVLISAQNTRIELGLDLTGSYLADTPNAWRDYENEPVGHADSSSDEGYSEEDSEDVAIADDDIILETQQDYDKFLNDLIEAFNGTKKADPKPEPAPQPEPDKEPKANPFEEYDNWLKRILKNTEQTQRNTLDSELAKWIENIMPKKVIDPKQQARDFVTNVLTSALSEMDKLNEELHKLNERRRGK